MSEKNKYEVPCNYCGELLDVSFQDYKNYDNGTFFRFCDLSCQDVYEEINNGFEDDDESDGSWLKFNESSEEWEEV